jgi:hypothetical protein
MRRFLTGAVRIGRARLGQTADEDVGRYRVRLDDVTGRYLEIRVRFKGACSSGQTPYLCNLVVYNDVGDMNNDQKANNFDITPFVYAMTHTQAQFEAQYPQGCYWCGDVNEDGLVNNFDITPYVSCLVAGGCGCP